MPLLPREADKTLPNPRPELTVDEAWKGIPEEGAAPGIHRCDTYESTLEHTNPVPPTGFPPVYRLSQSQAALTHFPS